MGDSCGSRALILALSSSDRLVIGDVVCQAAVKDADEAVAESPQGCMVAIPGASVCVVERPCPWIEVLTCRWFGYQPPSFG